MYVTVNSTVFAPAAAEAPAGAYDLTTLANARDELGFAENDKGRDGFLSRAITQESAALANYCNRVFSVEGVSDQFYFDRHYFHRRFYHRGRLGPAHPLQLSRYPLCNIATFSTSGDVTAGDVLPFADTEGAVAGYPVSGLNIAPGTTVESVADDVSVTLSLPVLGAIPEGTPITFGLAVVQTSLPSSSSVGLVFGQDFQIDTGAGHLLRLDAISGEIRDWEELPTTVAYFAGYATIPADLEAACLRLVTWRYHSSKRDPSIRETNEPGLGSTSYWVGGPPKSGALPEEVAGVADRYKMPLDR